MVNGPIGAARLTSMLLLTLALAACSSESAAKSVTCNEWVESALKSDKVDYPGDLLEAYDMDRYSINNTMGLTSALLDYCGDPITAVEGKARRNGNSPIDNAVDWEEVKRTGNWPTS